MVRVYVRKTNRGGWDERKMVAAMNAILTRKMGYLKGSKVYGIPRSTLRRIVKRLQADGEVNIRVPLGTNASVFTKQEELYLVSHLNSMENRLFSVTIPIKRKLAYQLAAKHRKSHKWKDGVAGREWLREFVKRHKIPATLVVGRPTTKPKVACFNKEAVMKFYEVLGELYLKHNFTADRIYNCDETSISCDTKPQGSAISFNENTKTPVATGDSGHTITVEVCMGATGLFMPLLFVFPRKTLEPQFTSNLILPCYTQCNETGWMQSDIFAWWLNHFIKFSRATKEKPVLLLMDADASHTTSLELIEMAEANGVIMLCLPEYCTHKLGPLEVEFFGTLSKHYVAAVKEWSNTQTTTQTPGIYEIPMLFEQAFIQSATLATAVVAFRKTGVWPFKPNTFSDHDFTGIGTSLLPHQMAATLQQQQPRNQPVTIQQQEHQSSPIQQQRNQSAPIQHQQQQHQQQQQQQQQHRNQPPTIQQHGNQPPTLQQQNTQAAAIQQQRNQTVTIQQQRSQTASNQQQRHQSSTVHQQSNLSTSNNSSSHSTNSAKGQIHQSPIPVSSWKPTNNCAVNEMRVNPPSSCGQSVMGAPQNQPPRKRIYPEPAPVPSQNYQTNNFHETPVPGPSWKPPISAVNEMRLSASSAYVEAVLGGPQNHPTRNMEQSEGPGSSCDPSMYSIMPHMFL